MKYKLIAIDMDGTLLNSNQEISKRNREALHRAKEQGVHIILTTGRILKSALYYSKLLNLSDPVISSNGAIISRSNGKDIIYKKPIEYSLSKKIMELLEENNAFYNFYDETTFYSKESTQEIAEQRKAYSTNTAKQGIGIQIFKNPIKVLNDNPTIFKFIIIEEDKNKIINLREKLETIEGISVSSSWYNNIEIMREGVSKGSGLIHLCKNLNIDFSEIIAIGDNENDISMLKIAGLSVAMGNSEQVIRKYSDIVTDTNDKDGVAKVIEKYVLI